MGLSGRLFARTARRLVRFGVIGLVEFGLVWVRLEKVGVSAIGRYVFFVIVDCAGRYGGVGFRRREIRA